MATIFEERSKVDKVEDLDPKFVDRVAIKAVSRLLDRWDVDTPTAAHLAGVRKRTWLRMKAGDWPGELNQDQRMRMSALVGLYEGLHVYFSEGLAANWVQLENDGPLFRGASPLTFMVEGGLPAIIRVRDYIDAVRAGL